VKYFARHRWDSRKPGVTSPQAGLLGNQGAFAVLSIAVLNLQVGTFSEG